MVNLNEWVSFLWIPANENNNGGSTLVTDTFNNTIIQDRQTQSHNELIRSMTKWHNCGNNFSYPMAVILS